MIDTEYPQDITADEADLGFKRLEFENMGRMLEPIAVVARILSSSDILVKILDLHGEIKYSLMRYGFDKTMGSETGCRWKPLSSPIPSSDVAMLVQGYDFEEARESCSCHIIGVPFTSREP